MILQSGMQGMRNKGKKENTQEWQRENGLKENKGLSYVSHKYFTG